jgi:hypothetical protein
MKLHPSVSNNLAASFAFQRVSIDLAVMIHHAYEGVDGP